MAEQFGQKEDSHNVGKKYDDASKAEIEEPFPEFVRAKQHYKKELHELLYG